MDESERLISLLGGESAPSWPVQRVARKVERKGSRRAQPKCLSRIFQGGHFPGMSQCQRPAFGLAEDARRPHVRGLTIGLPGDYPRLELDPRP